LSGSGANSWHAAAGALAVTPALGAAKAVPEINPDSTIAKTENPLNTLVVIISPSGEFESQSGGAPVGRFEVAINF
jgi:hypothetical protein